MNNNRDNVAAAYTRANFQPADRLAIILLNKTTGEVTQRIATAEKIASAEYQAFLRAMNAGGRDIYISMNALAPAARGRTKADVESIRHIYLDLDHDGKQALARIVKAPGMPDPNHVVNTSPEKYQLIWRVEGFSKQAAEELMRGLAAHHCADAAATDCARVLRLPGFRNHKYDIPHYVGVQNNTEEVYRPEHFPPIDPVRVVPASAGSTPERSNLRQSSETQSERDWNYALRHLARGESPGAVADAIMRFRPDKPNPAYYAEHTVRKAADAVARRRYNGPDR